MQNFSLRNSLRMNNKDRSSEQMDAVTVKVEGKDFVVKRSLLVDNSHYFKERLPPIESGTLSKKKKPANSTLELNGVSTVAFKWLIKFMLDERLDVGKCFEDDDLRDPGEIVDAAKRVSYEDLLRACCDYAENWYGNSNLEASYAMAKKLNRIDVENDITTLVLRLLLPDNLQENGRLPEVKLEEVPYDLLVDALIAFDNEEKRREVVSFKEERSSSFLLSRLKKVLKWLVARRDVPANGAQQLLSRLMMEEIPLPKIENAVCEILIHKNKYPALVRAVETELNRFKRAIAAHVTELLIVESKGLAENESKISKYAFGDGEERWKEIFFKADFELVDAAVLGDVLYLFGVRCLATYRGQTSERIGYQKYPNEFFACKSVYVDADAIYLIGDDSKTSCLTLGRYSFYALSWYWKPLQPGVANRPALTINQGVVYYLNGTRCYGCNLDGSLRQDMSTRILADLRILAHDRQAKPFLVHHHGFLYVFSGSTFFKVSLEREEYMENLGWTLSKILDLPQRAVCNGKNGVFVSAVTEKNEEDSRIVKYDFQTDAYPTIGYLPSHQILTGANRFYILRR